MLQRTLSTLFLVNSVPFAITVGGSTSGQCDYSSEVYLTGNPDSKFVSAITDEGLIGGDIPIFLDHFAFVSTPTSFIVFPNPSGFDRACLEDMTGTAFLVGAVTSSQGGSGRACIWQNGIPSILEPFKGANNSWANGCNSSGTVVGVSSDVNDGLVWEGFVWTHESGMQGLNSAFGTQFSDAIQISETGAIVGMLMFEGTDWNRPDTSAFIYKDGGLQILGPVPAGAYAVPMDIAGDDLAVGFVRYDTEAGELFVPWYLNAAGEIEELELPAGAFQAKATSVCPAGHIVGLAWFPDNERRPVLWVEGIPYLADELAELPSEGNFTTIAVLNNNCEIAITASLDDVNGTQPTKVSPTVFTKADLNIDCTVDVYDLLRLLSEWGRANSVADIDESGMVDVNDLLILISQWST